MQPNLVKAIHFCDNLYSLAQQLKPETTSNAEVFHNS